MELLDREFQREVLLRLADAYPGVVPPTELGFDANAQRSLVVNLHYLAEHGLVQIKAAQHLEDVGPIVVWAKATSKGLDFLQQDGGLSAILGVVTVRLEAETLRSLIDARVQASDLPAEEKSMIRKGIESMGSEALKELTKKLVAEAVTKWPQAIQTIQMLVHQVAG